MRLRIKDDVYEVDEDHLTVAEAKVFKRNSDGMGAYELRRGLLRGDPDVMVFLCWLAKTRSGEKRVTWSSFDDLDLVSDVEILPAEEPARDADEDDESDSGQGRADPTKTSGQTQKTASTTTSRRSRSTSGSTRAK